MKEEGQLSKFASNDLLRMYDVMIDIQDKCLKKARPNTGENYFNLKPRGKKMGVKN